MDTITIYHKGPGVLVYKNVADKLGLKHGQVIQDEETFRSILRENAGEGIKVCDTQTDSSEGLFKYLRDAKIS